MHLAFVWEGAPGYAAAAMAAPPASEPRRFGKYQILDRIAVGGMAEIFRARMEGIGGFQRSFAIKRIAPHLSSNHEFVDMLVDEAKVAGLLSHANIVQILDLGSVDQQFYIAMEFVNGRDLGKVLARCAEKSITLPVAHAVYAVIEMLKGLEYAHNRQVMRGGKPVPLNIVHRDISPGNVLVSFQGEVKLTDFGIAKASVKALETMSGVLKGRFDYMSPEQASGAVVDQRSDLFSAGVLFYQVLTGCHPFRQTGELATLEAVRRGVFVPPSEVNPDVPYALDLVVERALRVSPGERHQSAAEFKEGLDRFFHDSGFIFSASTLAAFMRGLFPESAPAERRPSPDVQTRLIESDELELDEEESASQSTSFPIPPTSESPTVELRTLSMDDLLAPSGDVSTLIRTGRAGFSPPPVEMNPFAGEANTVIRPLNTGDLDGGDTADLQVEPRVQAPVPRPSSRAASRMAVQVHAAWALVCFAAAVAAFVLGVLTGSRLHPAAPPAIRTQSEP